jgi:hypothetical protein
MQIRILLLFTILSFSNRSHAQDTNENTLPKYKIAVFAPLYLDSIYKNNSYQYTKKFPRFALQGLALIQGMEIASDSFPISDGIIETLVFDTKSDTATIRSILENNRIDDCKLIIVSGKDKELKELEGFAKFKSIPLISVTYPNDAGIRNNAFYVLMNATLKTHCERIFSYLLQQHSQDNLILATQTGSQEERVLGYFNAINTEDAAPLLPMKNMTLDSNYFKIKSLLDSNKNNIIIIGSLDETFAAEIYKSLQVAGEKYDIKILGMPNSNTYKFLSKGKSGRSIPFYYTTPYFTPGENQFAEKLKNAYLERYKGLPSESAFKGFEIMYIFSRLIVLFPGGIMNHLNDGLFTVFNEFQFMPVYIDNAGHNPDYWENKHLYLIKKQNGSESIAE